ncbi:unnamed protein product [Closterium sp. Naga37s-1]|nr:unnamed protein product [Closterium sp. Naga37s-1]
MSRILVPEQYLFLAVLAFFFLVSLLQLRVTWVEKLSALDLPPEGFASLAKTGQPIGTKLSQRAMLAYTSADIAALHRAMQEDSEQVRQQLAAGMEGVAREVGQLRQASSKAAGDAAQVLREGQEGLQQLQAEIKELKARVRRQGEELSQQMVTLARLQASSKAAGDAAQVLREGQEGLQQLQTEIRELKARVHRQGRDISQQMAALARVHVSGRGVEAAGTAEQRQHSGCRCRFVSRLKDQIIPAASFHPHLLLSTLQQQARQNNARAAAAAATAAAVTEAGGGSSNSSGGSGGRGSGVYHRPWRRNGFRRWKITDDRPQYWRQRVFEKYGAYGFVKFSAYRMSARRIAIIGMVPVAMEGKTRLRGLLLTSLTLLTLLPLPPIPCVPQCIPHECKANSHNRHGAGGHGGQDAPQGAPVDFIDSLDPASSPSYPMRPPCIPHECKANSHNRHGAGGHGGQDAPQGAPVDFIDSLDPASSPSYPMRPPCIPHECTANSHNRHGAGGHGGQDAPQGAPVDFIDSLDPASSPSYPMRPPCIPHECKANSHNRHGAGGHGGQDAPQGAPVDFIDSLDPASSPSYPMRPPCIPHECKANSHNRHGAGGHGGQDAPQGAPVDFIDSLDPASSPSYPMLLLCTFDSATKAAGGHLEARIEQEILFPYREEASEPLEAPSPLPLNIAACVAPIHGTIDARRLLERLHFHRVLLPVDRFLLYDAGGIAGNGEAGAAHKEVQRVLAPRVKRGMVDVMWRFREVLQWDVWNYGEDCIYRTRNAARWLLVSDIDEYLQIPPPLSLPVLLQEHESLPWLTFGATAFNGSFCSPLQLPPQAAGGGEGDGEGGGGEEGTGGGEEEEEERKRAAAMAANEAKAAFAVERMRFRWPHPVCSATDVYSASQCLGEEGSRRYILDPRQAGTATANSVASSRPGINLPVETARLARFPGISQLGFATCTLGEPSDSWWEREEGVAALAEAARRCPALKPRTKGASAEVVKGEEGVAALGEAARRCGIDPHTHLAMPFMGTELLTISIRARQQRWQAAPPFTSTMCSLLSSRSLSLSSPLSSFPLPSPPSHASSPVPLAPGGIDPHTHLAMPFMGTESRHRPPHAPRHALHGNRVTPTRTSPCPSWEPSRGIDPHTHLAMPFMGTESCDDFFSGQAAALAGGTTFHIDYVLGATPEAGGDLLRILAEYEGKARGNAVMDYGFHMGVTRWSEAVERDMEEVVRRGINSFKFFMAYKGALQVDDQQLLDGFTRCKQLGAIPQVHAENGDAVVWGQQHIFDLGITGPEGHPLSRPPEVEEEATGRAIRLANVVGVPLYVVHVMSAGAAREVAEARRRGQRVVGEPVVSGIALNDSHLWSPDFQHAAQFVMSPPIRSAEHVAAVKAALATGTLQLVATDHCPFNSSQKAKGRHDFRLIPNGVNGIEERMHITWDVMVNSGLMSPSDYVRITSTECAKIFNLYPQKGVVAEGSDADVIVLNPRGSTTISAATHHSRIDTNVYEGWRMQGNIEVTVSQGRVVWQHGRLNVTRGAGRFVPMRPFGPLFRGIQTRDAARLHSYHAPWGEMGRGVLYGVGERWWGEVLLTPLPLKLLASSTGGILLPARLPSYDAPVRRDDDGSGAADVAAPLSW